MGPQSVTYAMIGALLGVILSKSELFETDSLDGLLKIFTMISFVIFSSLSCYSVTVLAYYKKYLGIILIFFFFSVMVVAVALEYIVQVDFTGTGIFIKYGENLGIWTLLILLNIWFLLSVFFGRTLQWRALKRFENLQ